MRSAFAVIAFILTGCASIVGIEEVVIVDDSSSSSGGSTSSSSGETSSGSGGNCSNFCQNDVCTCMVDGKSIPYDRCPCH